MSGSVPVGPRSADGPDRPVLSTMPTAQSPVLPPAGWSPDAMVTLSLTRPLLSNGTVPPTSISVSLPGIGDALAVGVRLQGENPVLCAPPRPPHRWHRARRSVALARCRLRPRHRSACSPACLMPALDTVHFSRDPPRSTAAADTEGLVARIALARTPPPAKTSPRWTFFRGWRARSRPADMPALGRTGQTRAGYRPCSRPRFCATELPNADPSCLVALGM